jgi:hypothetical protein
MPSSIPAYNINYNAYNAFRSGHNANNKGQFFQGEGAASLQADPSEVLTSRIPGEHEGVSEIRAPRTGVGSGININFCPVINPTISPQFNPSIQPEIKPIINTLSSNGLREMVREDEPSMKQPKRIGSNSPSIGSICAGDKGEQHQINSIVLRQCHSSIQPKQEIGGYDIIQEPAKTIIINNYYGSEYSCGPCAEYLQRSRRLSEPFGIGRQLHDKQKFAFQPFIQMEYPSGCRPLCNLYNEFMQEFLYNKKRRRSRGLFRKCDVYQLVGYDTNINSPISLINKVLEKFSRGELGVMILPNWSGQSWSYMLEKLSVKMKILGRSEEVLFPGV